MFTPEGTHLGSADWTTATTLFGRGHHAEQDLALWDYLTVGS
jgi:hypothetical protein